MRLSWLLLFALACTGTTEDDPIDSSDSSTDSGSTDTGIEPSCDLDSHSVGDSAATGTLSGVITDASGAPLEDAEIGLCRAVCRSVCTDATGAFSYDGIGVDTFSFHVRPPHDQHDLFDIVFPLDVAANDTLTQNVQLVTAPTAVALPGTAAELEVATGLHITVGQGDLSILFEDDPTDIGAVPFTTAFFPTPANETFLGGWLMTPYDAEADPGLPIRFTNTFGVATGASVIVRTSSYGDFVWQDMGTFTESNGFLVADNATTGRLPRLATLIITAAN
ncbi:MAG: carboxypeptidase regulatory-like domain-containing protein [Proteobacteria bacterium]|nr:carboxypeptidase regulatory-like domain-containing protein [Pseudomonadota bacterium]